MSDSPEQLVIERGREYWVGLPHGRLFDSIEKAKHWGETVKGDVDHNLGFKDEVLIQSEDGQLIDSFER